MDTQLNHHSISLNNSPYEEMATEEIFDCSYPDCNYKSMWKENVGCHEKGHNPTKQWNITCQVCPQILTSLVSFFHHMSSQHSNKLFCPWCLFLGEDLTEYKAHVLAHDGTLSISNSRCNNKNDRSLNAQLPKSMPQKPSAKTTKGTSKFCCGTCFKSFNHGSSLSRHKKKNGCNSNSFAIPAQTEGQIQDDSQESHEDPELAKATDADETILSVDEVQSEGAAEVSIEKKNIEGETFYSCNICSHKTKRRRNLKTHFLVHTDHSPFGCPIKDCKYRAKSLQRLRTHSILVHRSDLPPQKNAETPKENLGLGMDCDNQTEVDINNANFSMAFACTLCEFVGDSELTALEHAKQHKTPSF